MQQSAWLKDEGATVLMYVLWSLLVALQHASASRSCPAPSCSLLAQGRKPEEYYPVLCSLPLAPAEAAAAAGAPLSSEGDELAAAAGAGAVQAARVGPPSQGAAESLEGSEDAGPATQPAAVPGSTAEAATEGP